MASPPTTATAMGRKTGSTMASAAAGYRFPLDRTSDSSVGPWPGGGTRCVTTTNTATSTGSPHSSARLTQFRGRRASLTSSTLIMRGLLVPGAGAGAGAGAGPGFCAGAGGPGPRHPVDAVGAGRGQGQHQVLQRPPLGADLGDRDARADQPRVQRRGIG